MTFSTSRKRLGTVLLLCSIRAVALHAQDGVCKKNDLPTDYVAVEEFNSPECDDGVNPFAKNAWRAEHVRDGITVCALPRYEVRGAKVAELLTCEHVVSDKCSPRLDGLSNAAVLRSPAECAKRGLPNNLKINCSASVPLDRGASGYMVATMTSPTCPPAPLSTRQGYANAWLSRKVDPSSRRGFLSICADDFNIGPSDFIVRRFKNSNCPVNPRVSGAQEGLTGWIIRLDQPPAGEALTLCEAFTTNSSKQFGPDWIGYQVPVSYSELCGGQAQKPNSFGVKLENGLWFSDASPACLTGPWHEEVDGEIDKNVWPSLKFPGSVTPDWKFGLNGDELVIKRDDGVFWASFHRYAYDAGWIGTLNTEKGEAKSSGAPYVLQITADCKRAHLSNNDRDITWFRKIHE